MFRQCSGQAGTSMWQELQRHGNSIVVAIGASLSAQWGPELLGTGTDQGVVVFKDPLKMCSELLIDLE